jgi:hypothetical protein
MPLPLDLVDRVFIEDGLVGGRQARGGRTAAAACGEAGDQGGAKDGTDCAHRCHRISFAFVFRTDLAGVIFTRPVGGAG